MAQTILRDERVVITDAEERCGYGDRAYDGDKECGERVNDEGEECGSGAKRERDMYRKRHPAPERRKREHEPHTRAHECDEVRDAPGGAVSVQEAENRRRCGAEKEEGEGSSQAVLQNESRRHRLGASPARLPELINEREERGHDGKRRGWVAGNLKVNGDDLLHATGDGI